MEKQKELQLRTKLFLQTLGLPMTVFAAHVKLSRQAVYRWLSDDLILSIDTTNRIDEFISKFGF